MRGKDRNDRAHDVVLDRKNVLERAVVVLGPSMGPGGNVDQLSRDANAISGLARAAFQQIADAQFAPDPAHVYCSTLVLKARITSDDEQLGEAGELCDDVFDNAVNDIFL